MELKKALDTFYYSTALCDLKLMNKQFEDEKITYNSLLYLELIFSLGGKCTSTDIAKLLYISKPAVTLKIKELIEQGLVIKTPDKSDKRKFYLSVNEEKMPKYKIYKAQDQTAIERIKSQFSSEDIHKFCQMLNIISDINFEEIEKK